MRIKETIERDCCQHIDLVEYKAGYPRKHPLPQGLRYCKHCGQWWCRHADGEWKRIVVTQWQWEDRHE